MKRLRRVLCYTIAGLLAAGVLAELGIYLDNVGTRREAEALLNAIHQLRVGESTLSSTESFRIGFRARTVAVSPVSGTPPQQRYEIIVANVSLYKLKLKFPSLWGFGLRPTSVEADLTYQNERLISVGYMLHAPALTSSGEPVELVPGVAVEKDSDGEHHSNFSVVYRIRPSPIAAKALEVRFGALLTSRATQEEREAAFDFDLSCISSLRGCQAFCQMVPSVWREASRRFENKEISLPKEVLETSLCVRR
jgi:hypothetical protein